MGATYNPVIQQNATWQISVTILNADSTPFDLTGYTGESQIRPSYGSNTVLATPTVTITTPTSGQLTIGLTNTQTGALTPTSTISNGCNLPVWDVLISNTGNTEVINILKGQVTILPGVTKWT
jgi:hypothetical protein